MEPKAAELESEAYGQTQLRLLSVIPVRENLCTTGQHIIDVKI